MTDVSLNDVIDRIKGNEDRNNTSLLYYVGGEHYVSNSIELRNGGLISEGVLGFKFHFPFRSGDVLFMARNPHLQKAARVDFDGICSDASYILRSKNENILLQDFLPLIVQSDHFWSFFRTNKTGSVNPLLNWSTLSTYKFNMPSLVKQRQYADLVWTIQYDINKLEEQLNLLDRVVKSQFIKMFGDLSINDKSWKSDKLSNVLVIERGGSPRPIDDYITNEETGLNWIKIGDANDNSIYIDSVKEKIKPEGLKKTRRVYPDDLILSNSMSFGKPYILKISGCIHDGWLVLHDENDIFDKIFLCYALGNSSTTKKFKSMARGAVVNNLNKKIVGSLEIILPPRNLQNQFADFVKQVDKSKFELQQHIDNTKKLQKTIINSIFQEP